MLAGDPREAGAVPPHAGRQLRRRLRGDAHRAGVRVDRAGEPPAQAPRRDGAGAEGEDAGEAQEPVDGAQGRGAEGATGAEGRGGDLLVRVRWWAVEEGPPRQGHQGCAKGVISICLMVIIISLCLSGVLRSMRYVE